MRVFSHLEEIELCEESIKKYDKTIKLETSCCSEAIYAMKHIVNFVKLRVEIWKFRQYFGDGIEVFDAYL